MSNFAFLQTEWPDLYDTAHRTEEYVQSDPRSACFHARRALELAVHWLYAHDRNFTRPYDDNLVVLLNDPSFRNNVPALIITKTHIIRKEGNRAVHSNSVVSAQMALGVAVELHHVLYWLARTYTTGNPAMIPGKFDERLLPAPPPMLSGRALPSSRPLTTDCKPGTKICVASKPRTPSCNGSLPPYEPGSPPAKPATRLFPTGTTIPKPKHGSASSTCCCAKRAGTPTAQT